jgi:Ca2+-binding RTX toxin-like protein
MANITLTSGADLWSPGATRDVLSGTLANLSDADVINLGDGAEEDVFVLTSAGTFDARPGGNAANVIGYERLNLAAGGSQVFLTQALVIAAYAGTARAGQFAILSNGGSDTIDASLVGATGRITLLAGGGADSFIGGAGADLVRFNATELTAADSVNGGAGLDTLRLDTAGATAADAFANVRRIETIELAAGGSSVVLGQAMAASADGGVLAVVARGGANVVDGSAVTTAVNYFAGAGADSYVGGTGVDRVHVTPATLTAADSFDGGGGAAIDLIRITAAGAFAADAFAGVRGFERIYLAAGGNSIVLNDAVFAGVNTTAYVIGAAGNDTLDASAMTRAITFDPGAGTNVFMGGSGNDFVLLNPAESIGLGLFDGGPGHDTILLKAGGTFVPIAGFEQVTLSAAGNVVLGGLHAVMADPLVVGGAGNDDVDLAAGVGRALLGAGDNILRIGPGDVALRSDGGAGRDTLIIQGAQPVTVHGGRGFEVVALATGAQFDQRSVSFAGAAQDWTVTGLDAIDTVTTGAGTYDLRLGSGSDTYRIAGGTLVTVLDQGSGLTADTLVVEAGATGAFVSADLGEGQDTYLVQGGRLVSIVDLAGNNQLDLSGAPATTQVFAQFGGGGDTVLFTPRTNAMINLGGNGDTLTLRAGNSAGSLLHAGDGAQGDTLVLDGPGWGAITFDQLAVDQLRTTADGGAIQSGFASLNAAAATQAVATMISNGNSVTLTPGDDTLNIRLINNFSGPNGPGAFGGAGTDTVNQVDPSNSALDLSRYSGFEVFNGSAGNDVIRIASEAVTANAGAGDDVVSSGSANATVSLGAGVDVFQVSRNGGVDTLLDLAGDNLGGDGIRLNVTANGDEFFATHLPYQSLDPVIYNNSGVFPLNALVILTNGVLASTAAVDAFLDALLLAPPGGVFVVASGGPGAGARLYYDPNAANVGGANAPELLVMLPNMIVPTNLLDNFDVF